MRKLLLTIGVLGLLIGTAEACPNHTEKNTLNLDKVTIKVANFLESEKSKTIEYQKKSWADAKEQIATLFKKIGLVK
jgi:hypothetical protein|tara:strand:+ start:234 stop:464 length:231 start_codon:yes stop_codon:yes gene_type:complete